QPAGAEIDAMQGTVMNQAQFRKFDDHNSAIFNFVVNVAPLGEEQAGIRWYELRQTGDGQPWTIYQEGTYVSPTGNNAFGASMAMDGAGSIAMGYTTVSADLPVTLNFTGRYTNDPLGEMSVPEAFLASSTGVSTSERYADYTHLTIDPADDETFWFISEYFNPQRTDIVSVFKLAPDNANDVQVIAIDNPQDGALSATESISITLRNAGSTTQASIPVSYTVDGITVEETYTGSLAFNETASYTFTQTADLSTIGADYTIEASTNLENDEDTSNDTMSITVKNLWQNDVGVASIDTPESDSGLGAAIAISVTVTNYGQDAQSNFPVYYQLNDGEQVTETFDRSIAAQTSETFTFSTTEDFSAIGTYEITAGTALETDSDTSNDIASVTVTNDYCQPDSNCSGFGDGVTQINLEGTTVTTACSETGFTANLDTVFDLDIQNDPYTGVLQVGYQNSDYAIFIDFNNNGGFETSELVSSGTAPFADVDAEFELELPEGVALGTYRMRVRGADSEYEGDVTDACGELAYGRTNDYSVRIFNSLSVEENIFPESELVILEPEQNHFQISLSTEETTEKMAVSVYSILGQKLAENWIENEYGSYVYGLDMSYAASGVYIVRIGNRTGGQSKKIIVK
ncbi:MAG: GEVED domain-containing protein, partial [Bacteroidota bacterium]|nr:GEVED domain-containing protein [Bacteroidota bacterium]